MKQVVKAILSDTRDLIALLLVVTYCVSVFLPEEFVSVETKDYFNTLMMMVLGYFFGRASSSGRKSDMENTQNSKIFTPINKTTCIKEDCIERKL